MGLDKQQLALSLQLRNVQRFQTHRLQHRQNVDQHSFRATMLYDYFGGTEHMAMLTHDLEEALTGDIPSPAKKRIKGLEFYENMRIQFSDPNEAKLGKLCDKLELVLDLREQLEDTGQLPKKLMNIYENEYDKTMDIAKELKLDKEVKFVLKTVSATTEFEEFVKYLEGKVK